MLHCCVECVFACCAVLMHMCMHACLSVCVHAAIRASTCVYVCLHVCTFMCVYFAGMGVSQGAALCLSHLLPHSTDTQGNGKKGGEFILEKGIGSSGVMGNNAGFTDGKRQRTPAGCVEANLPTSLTKQLATPVKI